MITMRVMGQSLQSWIDVAPTIVPGAGAMLGTDAGGSAHSGLARLSAMGLYAAYGSNMDPAQMLQRCPSSPFAGTGWIRGWRLTFGAEEFGWEGALATIVPDESPEQLHPGVFAALYDLTDADEKALDAWEGADSGLYRRVHLRVHTLAA